MAILLTLARSTWAQSTTVSGQVIDAGGQSWNNGTVTASFVPNPLYVPQPQYVWTGGALNFTITGTLTGTGSYSISVPSNSAITPVNSSWKFQFCPQATSPCFTTGNVTVTGATQTVNATPPAISISPGPGVLAYADAEILNPIIGSTYYNVTSNAQRVCNGPAPCTWAVAGGVVGGAPTKWVNITQSPYFAVDDGRDVLCGVTNTTPNVTSAALFLPSDAGKEIYIYNSNNGNAFTLGTISSVTDTSDIVLSGNATQTVGTQQCHIGTNNYAAIHAAELALTAGQTLYFPVTNTGVYMWDNHQIFNSGIFASSTSPFTLMGDGQESTQLWFPPFATTATTSQVLGMANNTAYVHDFKVVPGPEVANSTSNQNFMASITGNPVENVRIDNFVATSIPTACWASQIDGTTAINPVSKNCAVGLYDQWKTQSIIHGQFNGSVNGAKLFDFGGQLIGGTISCTGANCSAITNVAQGTPEAWQILGVTIFGNGTGCAYTGAANTSAVFVGNNLGNRLGTNTSDICLTAASARAYSSHNSMFSQGTGFNYNNAGQLYKDGTDQMVQVGTAVYTGAGTVNGKTTLTGTAYANATNTFTVVVGGSGEPFLWNVDANDQLDVTCHLYYQSAATGGLNIEFTGPAGFTALHYSLLLPVTTGTAPISSEASGAYSTSLGAAVGTAATDFDALVTFSVTNGATAGNVTLLARSQVTVANGLTIQPGSFCQSQ